MSEADFGLTKKGGHAKPDGKSAPLVTTTIDAGAPSGSTPGDGDISAYFPDVPDNNVKGMPSPVSGPGAIK
jgi:hypothetical protein